MINLKFSIIFPQKKKRQNLKKCTKCILPSTYPFIEFDNEGVSSTIKDTKKQNFLGEDKLFEIM